MTCVDCNKTFEGDAFREVRELEETAVDSGGRVPLEVTISSDLDEELTYISRDRHTFAGVQCDAR